MLLCRRYPLGESESWSLKFTRIKRKIVQPLFTDRLFIEPLTFNDTAFILELVNTEGWLTFIGNRNVHSEMDAKEYIQKIIDNSNTDYSLVKRKEDQTKIGIITFIQRDYLDHPDIGFAFLPAYSNKGYAYEATKAVLKNLIETNNLAHILATTIPENLHSIKLLKKLGLSYEKEIEVNKVKLQIYGAATEKIDFG